MSGAVHIFGIRHHGPGSARSLRRALEELRPDVVLVEGPPDAAGVLPLIAAEGMRPPVALLIYDPDSPRQAVYYPFALFSPEWQAIDFALRGGLPVRFMDLPIAAQLRGDGASEVAPEPPAEDAPGAPEDGGEPQADPGGALDPQADPIGALAAAAGYSDGERWWEHVVEQRRDGAGLFTAILEAMAALRDGLPPPQDPREARREAWMRRTIRAALAEGFARIAVVCGAWHGPALRDLGDAEGDSRLLAGLEMAPVSATWVPWTYDRLTLRSGYGAGIESPGWYEHLWHASGAGHSPTEVAVRWMSRIAQLLRSEDLDSSSAHVIESVRLAEALAALRGRPLPGLPELSEAAEAVFCTGSPAPMQLIERRLTVGDVLGAVPETTPLAPLQQDLAAAQRRLRLPPEASWRDYELDLRKPNDLERSRLLHRLALLGVAWGTLARSGGGRGTFREQWRLAWQPELTIALIEAGVWGTTIAEAASAFARDAAERAPDLPSLTRLVDQALTADLPDAVADLMGRIDREAALSSDIAHLMGAIPPLASVLRYGSVRQTDAGAAAHVVVGLVGRVAVGLPGACASISDEAAEQLFHLLVATDDAVGLLQLEEQREVWHGALAQVAGADGSHGLLAGRSVRILLSAGALGAEEAGRRLGLALARAGDPTQGAAWAEGLLRGSGALVVHDDTLWQILDGWVASLGAEEFTRALPLLRRTFATFAAPERRALGERARGGPGGRRLDRPEAAFDVARAEAALATVAGLLGLAGVPQVVVGTESPEEVAGE